MALIQVKQDSFFILLFLSIKMHAKGTQTVKAGKDEDDDDGRQAKKYPTKEKPNALFLFFDVKDTRRLSLSFL
jgi:hypothetical protein